MLVLGFSSCNKEQRPDYYSLYDRAFTIEQEIFTLTVLLNKQLKLLKF